MKLVMFGDGLPGILQDDRIIDISAVVGDCVSADGNQTMQRIVENFDSLSSDLQLLAASEDGIAVSDTQLLAPLGRPDKIVAMGANYLENTDGPALPIFSFFKSQDSVIGPGDTVVLPDSGARVYHHEAEMVVVIGKEARNVPESEAMDYVFGYTAGIDVSGRHPAVPRSLFGKSHDTFCPLGPCIVTKDEIPDPHDLQVKLWVDGSLRHDFSTSDMGHRIPECIAFVSATTVLRPGDIIMTGTNHQGIGPLQDGDKVELDIEKIGRYQVSVSDPLGRSWPKGIDTEIGERIRKMVKLGIPPGAPGAPAGPK